MTNHTFSYTDFKNLIEQDESEFLDFKIMNNAFNEKMVQIGIDLHTYTETKATLQQPLNEHLV